MSGYVTLVPTESDKMSFQNIALSKRAEITFGFEDSDQSKGARPVWNCSFRNQFV